MSHEIDETTGRPAMAYVGAVPWHGLGVELAEGAGIDEWVSAAGLDWKALASSVQFLDESGDVRKMDGSRVLYRSDTQAPLSIVSDKYNVVQPREVLEFFRDLTRHGGFRLETAGALSGGTKVWALARRDMTWNIGGVDPIEGYLLLATSFDYSLATTAKLTTVRVVCNNTLTASLLGTHDRKPRPSTKVFHDQMFDADAMKGQLGVIDPAWESFRKDIDALVTRTVQESEVRPYFARVMFYKNDVDRLEAIQHALVEALVDEYQFAPGQELATAQGTAWGLVNAITHHVDHVRRARNPESRLNAVWFGAGEQVKARAWREALALVSGFATVPD